MQSGAENLGNQPSTPAKMAALWAQQVQRTMMSGASALTYGTGIIVPAAMAGVSGKELVAKSGYDERQARRVCEKNRIGHTDGDIRAGRVCD
jgi:hypothetical protein